MGAWRIAGAAVGVAIFAAAPARANGRFPQANQVLFSPGLARAVVLRTTYGLFVSNDGGVTWHYLCEAALGLPATVVDDPALALTASDALVAGLANPTGGLEVSNDTGCTWACVGGLRAGEGIVDLAVRLDAPHTALALSSAFVSGDAGDVTSARILQTADDGAHWAALGVPFGDVLFQRPRLVVTTVDVAPTDPHRIYVSATVVSGNDRKAVIFVSRDDGASFAEYELAAFDPVTESAIFIGGVDPLDADRFYVRTSAQAAGGTSRLFAVTAAPDAGLAFDVVLTFPVSVDPTGTSGQMLGFALSTDGAVIYAGSKERGLWVGARGSAAFTQAFTGRVLCLAVRGAELWACSDEGSGFTLGVSTDRGATFAPVLHSCDVPPAVACMPGAGACGANATSPRCDDSVLSNITAGFGCPAPDAQWRGAASDGGNATVSSETDAGTGVARGTRSSCACRAGPGGSASGLFPLAALAALVVARRRAVASRKLAPPALGS